MVKMEKKVKLTTKEQKYVKKLDKGFNITDADKKKSIECNETIDVDDNVAILE